MSLKNNMRAFLVTSLAAAALSPRAVVACAACAGGKSNDAMALGMNMGILALLIVVGTVLTAFAAFAVFLARRAARFPLQPESSASSMDAKEVAAHLEPDAEAQLAQPISQPTK